MTNSESDEDSFQRQVLDRLENLQTDVDALKTDTERSGERFTTYQQATQWVVQLAFTLIASATITVIITAVFKR
jgi:hypothetical protein